MTQWMLPERPRGGPGSVNGQSCGVEARMRPNKGLDLGWERFQVAQQSRRDYRVDRLDYGDDDAIVTMTKSEEGSTVS